MAYHEDTLISTANNATKIVRWNSAGDYSFMRLDEIKNNEQLVILSALVNPTNNHSTFAQISSVTSTYMISEDNTYDSDPILEMPSSIPARYQGGTCNDGTNDLPWNGAYWSLFDVPNTGDWQQVILYDAGDGSGFCWHYDTYNSSMNTIAYYRKFVGQTPAGAYTGGWNITWVP